MADAVRRPSVQRTDIIWTGWSDAGATAKLVTEHYMLHAIFRPGTTQRVVRRRQIVSRIRWLQRQRASK